ncbi:MAG: Xaa-Pro peptidase family protein [Actinomycetota bacterium]|nr:Xaa-Pro peptidase family protein [Actinomycetota bacterium]
MNARADKLRRELSRLGASTFLVSAPVNVEYLTGFESTNAVALVGDDGVQLVTDGRYIEAARGIEGVEAVEGERDLLAWLATRLGRLAASPVAFEAAHVSFAAYETLGEGGVELRPTRGVVEAIRAVKDERELEAIRGAARVLDEMYERLADERIVGRTEAELAWWVERTLREGGADGLAFPVIVGSGPNAALPHHHPGDREIRAGETVIVDAGARVDRYCSDCTRTFATGGLPDELRRAYEVCLEAQERALAGVAPGSEARELDALARAVLEEAALADVLHGLGHGVGLDVHELPRLASNSQARLEPGNVVTVEPGVYLAGRGGVRIEDLVVVMDAGADVLTPFSKDLHVLH